MNIDFKLIEEKYLTPTSRIKHLGIIENGIFKTLCYKESLKYSENTKNTKELKTCKKCEIMLNVNKNKYISDDIMVIPLTKNKFTLIDKEDFNKIKKYSWYACKGMKNVWYAYCNKPKLMMHRVIMNAKPNEIIDHKSRIGLDNRKCNLRIVNKSINNFNKDARIDNKSTGIKNIYWDNKNKKYFVRFALNKKKYWVGRFKTIEEAQEAKEQAILKAFEILEGQLNE